MRANYVNSVWRNTSQHWLSDLLNYKKIEAEKNRFISFSVDEESGGQDDFGKTRIEFDERLLLNQGLEEIIYNVEYFEDHPDICRYVTGYESEQDYYDNQDDFKTAEEAWAQSELDWGTVVEDYEGEQELVMKKIEYVPGLIKSVTFFYEKPSKKLEELMKKENIPYELG